MSSPIEVIINATSGSHSDINSLKEQVEEAFRARNLDANISLARRGAQISEFAERAAQNDCRTIVAGGGDGTISTIAAEVFKTEKTLGVLPLGTLNHFSKDLNIPQNIEDAVRVIAENYTKTFDVGEVNGQIFVNNSSIGLYPSIVHRREHRERLGYGKWSAAFWAAMKILRRAPFLDVKLKVEDKEVIRRTPFVFVGNNEYVMDFLNIGSRERLDEGKLSVYFLHKSGRRGLFSLALRLIFGRLRQAKDFEAINVEQIQIETRHKRIPVAHDGEVTSMPTPLQYRIHPQVLRVIVPRETEE
jgi:YegS/Rv2252/BmrU family lipid kinase